tara:strand:- start:403 stop:810 length:408 start_codon:yes stop_codon:yes gene_type:complete
MRNDGGLCFNGDSASSNALDDYEEGSWALSANSVTFTTYSGRYTKIGNIVHAQMYATVSSSSNNSFIAAGLPYTVRGSAWGASILSTNLSTATHFLVRGRESTTNIDIKTVADAPVTFASLNGKFLVFQITYQVA